MEIYLRMRGGLGNQMLQYGYALALAQRAPDARIWLDTREYRHYKRWNFELGSFVLTENTALFPGRRLRYDFPIKAYHVYQRLYREVHGSSPYGLNAALARRGMILTGRGCPLPEGELPEKVYLYGYFQNAAVFLPIREQLRRAYSLPERALSQIPAELLEIPEDSVAVSVRLGSDIVRSGWQLCSRDYYRSGVEAIRRAHSGGRVLVFSDQAERVRAEHWFDDLGEVVYVPALTPCEQMELLSRCRHFVISNSTFAWWGAFLGAGGDEGMIVAPRLWQGNLPTDETAMYLPNMTLL